MENPTQLELKHLAAYLPYGLQVSVSTKQDACIKPNIGLLCEITYRSNHGNWAKVHFEDCVTVTYQTWEQRFSNFHTYFISQDIIKPILRPLSDLLVFDEQKEMSKHIGRIYGTLTIQSVGIDELPHKLFEYLVAHHFDVFGLIDAGLAVDINSLASC